MRWAQAGLRSVARGGRPLVWATVATGGRSAGAGARESTTLARGGRRLLVAARPPRRGHM